MKQTYLIPTLVLIFQSCATPDAHQIELTYRALRDAPVREIPQDLAATPTPEPTLSPADIAFNNMINSSEQITTSEMNTLRETIEKMEHEIQIERGNALRDMYNVFWDVIEQCPLHVKCDIPDFFTMILRADAVKSNREQANAYEK